MRPAFSADRAEISGGVFFHELTSEGEMRLLGAKMSDLSLYKARLSGIAEDGEEVRPALNAEGIKVGGDIFCNELTSQGEVRLLGAKVGGQLGLFGIDLGTKAPGEKCLTLSASRIDEITLGFQRVEGIVDLTNAHTRILSDAGWGRFFGVLPETLQLQGFHYESLQEPLTPEQRLAWIERSQRDQHYPSVYAELAEAYRHIGNRSAARAIGIANERRAREDGTTIQKIWNYLLWKSVRYGYENWRAAIGLLVVIAIGSIIFGFADDHFVKTVKEPPDLTPVIYATDAAIPVLDLGQTSTWTVTGWLEWVELALAISGYALVAAVIAGLAGIFNRDQV
jgi:hypothetical protein